MVRFSSLFLLPLSPILYLDSVTFAPLWARWPCLHLRHLLPPRGALNSTFDFFIPLTSRSKPCRLQLVACFWIGIGSLFLIFENISLVIERMGRHHLRLPDHLYLSPPTPPPPAPYSLASASSFLLVRSAASYASPTILFQDSGRYPALSVSDRIPGLRLSAGEHITYTAVVTTPPL